MKLRSEDLHERARMCMASDPKLDYLTAIRLVAEDAETGGKRLNLAGVDPESLKLHEEILKVIEEEKAKGHILSYAEARRRVEMARSNR